MSKKKLLLIVLAVALVAGVVVFATSGEGLQGRMFAVKRLVPKVGNLCTDTGTPDLTPYISIVRTANYNPVTYKAQLWVANLSNVNVTNQLVDIHYDWQSYGSASGNDEGYGASVGTVGPLNIPCKKRALAKTVELSVPYDTTYLNLAFKVDSTGKIAESNEDNNLTSKSLVVNTTEYRPSFKSYVNKNGGKIMPGFDWDDLSVSPMKKYKHYFYTGEPPHTYEPTWSAKLYSAPFTMEPNPVAYYTASSAPYISGLPEWNVLSGCDQKTGKCQSDVYVGQNQTLYFMLEYKHKDGTLSHSNVFRIVPDGAMFGDEMTRCKFLDSLNQHGFLSPYTPEAATFSDVPLAHSCSALVEGANESDILGGYPDGTFGPDKNMKRAEVAKATSEAANLDTVTDGMSPFNDVEGADWFYSPIMALYFEGVLDSEAKNGQFSPGASATETWVYDLIEELEWSLSPMTKCSFLKNLAQHNLLTMYTPEAATFASDVPTNHDCFPYVEGAIKDNVMSGNPDGSFGPDTSISKADVSKTAVTVGNFETTSAVLPVSDVSESTWFYDYVATLFSKGFFQKESATGLFHPGNVATRYWTNSLLELVAVNKQFKPGETTVNVSVGPSSPQGAVFGSTGMVLGEFNVSFKDGNYDSNTGPEISYKIKSIDIQAVSNGVALCDLALYPKAKDLDLNHKKTVASQSGDILTFASDSADDVYGYFTVVSGLSQSYIVRADVTNAFNGGLALTVKGLTYHDNTSGEDIYVGKNIPLSNLSFASGNGTPASSDCYGLLNQ